MHLRKSTPSSIAIAVVMLFFVTIALRWNGPGGPRTIRSDVKGYYGYLQAIFITHDLGHQAPDAEYLHETPTGTLNKYFAGEPFMLLPFFLGAHATAHLFGFPADGLSAPYTTAIALAALLYALIGLLCLRALLRGLGVREVTTAGVLLIIGFATQLVQYVSMQPGWSHAYSFCCVSAFLWLVHRYAAAPHALRLVMLGALFGLIVLLRPVNGLVLLAVPVVLGESSWRTIRSMVAAPRSLALAIVACALVLFIQPLLWHAQTGHWIERGYQDEGFYWSSPRITQVLFSVRRGLFVWTPVLALAVLSTLALWRSDRVRASFSIVYWIANTYVIAAWWIWYYGGGFGLRVYIDHYPVLFIPVALMLDRWTGWKRTATLAFSACCSALLLVQFYQYNHGLLHPVSMDRAMYRATWLRFDPALRDAFGGNDQEPPYHPNGMSLVAEERCDLERPCTIWQVRNAKAQHAKSGEHVCVLDGATEFGPTLIFGSDALPRDHMAHLVVDLERYEEHAGDSFHALAALSVETPGQPARYYEPVRMNPMPGQVDGQWQHLHYEIPVVVRLLPGEEVRFYIWNKEHENFLIDDLEVKLYTVNPF